MRTVVIATNNGNKVREIAAMLDGCDCEFLTLQEAGIVSDPVEDADTFEGNARIKARAAFEQRPGVCVLADDSGLMVDALDGAPGVFSSRFAGEDATDADNNRLLLQKLVGVEGDGRRARFVCTMVLIDEDGNESVSVGEVPGIIGDGPRGEGGFGYDPLFYPDEFGHALTFAEVPASDKNAISHRAQALSGIKSMLCHSR